MNNRIAALCLAAAALMTAAGCAPGSGPPPQPTEVRSERADNCIGARYTFTLAELSDMLAEDPDTKTADMEISVRQSDWRLLSDGLVDDSGTAYSTYYCPIGVMTLTAAVENDSREVMNIGCGCDKDLLTRREQREAYIRTAAVIACRAGGYTDRDTAYLEGIFDTLLDGEEAELYYEGALYIKSEDKATVVLMVSPAPESGREKNTE